MKVKLLLLIIIIALSYTAYKIQYQPYEVAADISTIPTFTPVSLTFNHELKSQFSLPFLGSAIIDIDNDDKPEVFLGGGYLQRDGLFVYKEGRFEDISGDIGFSKGIGDSTYGAAAIDSNADGFTDLFVARDSGIYLYTNQKGFFVVQKLDIAFKEGNTPLSITAADVNADGFVDLFVSCFLSQDYLRGQTFNDSDYGANSLLLLNKGNNTFRDITESAGVDHRSNTFTAMFADLNQDRRSDLIVAYSTGPRIYKNMGKNRFQNMPISGIGDFSFPTGIAAADYNVDGKLDILFTNSGTTIPPILAKGDLSAEQTLNTDWMLLRNNGDFKFTDVAEEAKLAKYEFSWGPVFADFNLDGLPDIIAAGNYIKFWPQLIYRNPGKLLLQTPENTFASIEKPASVQNRRFGISSLVADFNDDGYTDLVQVNLDGPSMAYINNGGNKKYVKVILNDSPVTLGAKVSLETSDSKTHSQYMLSGQGMASDQTHTITFGLDQNTLINRITVRYLAGKTLTIEKPAVNQTIRFKDYKDSPKLIQIPKTAEPKKIPLPETPQAKEEEPSPAVPAPPQPPTRPSSNSSLEDDLERLLEAE